MKKTLALASILALCAAPALANEEHMKQKAEWYFGKMDTNGDGSVSRLEHGAFAEDRFAAADSNRDGAVSKDELLAQKKQEKEEYDMKYGDKDDDKE